MPHFEIVVSVENNTYLVWQAMLFHYSCVRYQGQAPIVVVHINDEPLLPGFERIRAAGGMVQTAPNYRQVGGVNYPPRNTAGTLRHVRTDADYIVLCDADMIFLQPIQFSDWALPARAISFDQLRYLDPTDAFAQWALRQACAKAEVPYEQLTRQPVDGGVPHIIPTGLRRELSDDWLHCLELFPTIGPWPSEQAGAKSRACHVGPQKEWLTTMWALVLAVHRLGLTPMMTNFCESNFTFTAPLPGVDPGGPSMLHYCYSNAGFDKHAFDGIAAAERTVWQQPTDDGTISGALRRQLREARTYYGLGEG